MTPNRDNRQSQAPRVLFLSQRNLYEQEVWRASFFEFEQILQQLDSVDVVAPHRKSWYRNGKRLALRLGERFKTPIDPGVEPVKLDKDYDVFFVVCEKASELLHVNAVKGRKDRCKTSFCLLTEFWVNQMAQHKSCLEMLSQFDHVLYMFNTYEPFQKYVRGTGRYMAAGIDALRFCPFPNPPARSIDVLSIGRRSEKTHQTLLRLAAEEGIFYVHDTIDSLSAYDIPQHRRMMADLLKRTRYFLVNPGKIDNLKETGGQVEFGYRYFEGAAPGTIMVGERPRNKVFPEIFHWDDVVIQMPFDSEDIGQIMKELDRQPERQMNIRRTNITQVLQHHDWAHRWETVLKIAGLDPLPALAARKEELQRRVAMVQGDQTVARPVGGR
jgi:hypothetical protein